MSKLTEALQTARQAEAAYQAALVYADSAERALAALIESLPATVAENVLDAGEAAEDDVACESLDLKSARVHAWAAALEAVADGQPCGACGRYAAGCDCVPVGESQQA